MKKLRFLPLLLCLVLLFTGCTVNGTRIYFATDCGPTTVFRIGSFKCSEKEAKLYLANYKNLYGSLGDTDLWSGQFDTSAMEESLKSATLSHLSKVYAFNQYAESNEILLTDSEKELADQAAEEYYDSLNKAELKYTGARKSDIKRLYERYALAEKVYVQLMDTVNEEVSEDEARIMDAQVLFTTDASLAKQLDVRFKNGATFERLASTYNESTTINVTFGRGTYDSAIDDVVFNLEDGETSECIQTDDGYYFFHCINKYDEELSEANKTKIVEQRRQNAIDSVIDLLDQNYYSQLNEKLWDSITIDADPEIQTDSLFSTLDSYLIFTEKN